MQVRDFNYEIRTTPISPPNLRPGELCLLLLCSE